MTLVKVAILQEQALAQAVQLEAFYYSQLALLLMDHLAILVIILIHFHINA